MTVHRSIVWAAILVLLLLLLALVFRQTLLRSFADEARPWIESQLASTTGLPITIQQVNIRFLPRPVVELKEFSARSSDSCAFQEVLIHRVIFKPDLLRLIKGSISLSQVILDQPSISYDDRHGEGQNCSLPAPAPVITEQDQKPGLAEQIVDPVLIAEEVSEALHEIRSISIKRANVRIVSKARRIELKDLSFESSVEFSHGELRLSHLNGNVQYRGESVTVASKALSLDTNALRLNAEEVLLSSPMFNLVLRGSVESGKSGVYADLTGFGAVTKFSWLAYDLLLERGSVSDLKITVQPNQSAVAAKITLEKFRIKDGENRYAAEKASLDMNVGVLQSAAGGQISIGASASVGGFSFADSSTEVKNVQARLTDVVGSITPRGDISFRLSLNGDAVEVVNSTVKVLGVKSVVSPLTVKIPARGGYEIKGPVRVQDARIELGGKMLASSTGEVQLLISAPLSTYSTQKITTVLNGLPLALSGNFEMDNTSYRLKGAQISGDKLSLSGAGSIKRRSPSCELSLKAQNTDYQNLLKVIPELGPSSAALQIEAFDLILSADRTSFLKTANGRASLRAQQFDERGRVKFTHSIASALSKAPLLGDLSTFILGSVSEAMKLRVETDFSSGIAEIRSLQYRAPRYTLESSGTVNAQGLVAMQGEVILMRKTARQVSLGIPVIKEIFTNAAEVKIPVIIDGSLPDARVSVNGTEFVKRYSGYNSVKGILGGALGVVEGVGSIFTAPFRGKSESVHTPLPTPSSARSDHVTR